MYGINSVKLVTTVFWISNVLPIRLFPTRDLQYASPFTVSIRSQLWTLLAR